MASLTPQAAASTVRLRDLRTTLDGVYLTLHVAAMGFTLVLPLLGAAWSPIDVGWRGLLWRVALGLSFHVFAYALNDVCDLPIDRTEPGRARDPLVRGVISVRTVTFLALGQLPVLAWLWAARGASVRTGAAIGVAVAALAAYDRWGKSLRHPVLTDLTQGVGWAALLLAGVPDESPIGGRVAMAGAAVIVYILLVNGIVGPVRDLANDLAAGARTTAIVLGVRPVDAGLHVPRRAAIYALVLHVVYLSLVVVLSRNGPVAARVVVAAMAMASTWIGVVVAPRVVRAKGALAPVGGAWIALSLGALVVTGLAASEGRTEVALCLAFGVPVGLMFARNRGSWA